MNCVKCVLMKLFAGIWVCMFGRGPNCYLLKSLYSPCCLIRLLAFMLNNVLSSVWESTSDGFFFFFFFLKTDCILDCRVSLEEQNRQNWGLKRIPKNLFFPTIKKCKVQFNSQHQKKMKSYPIVISLSSPRLGCVLFFLGISLGRMSW